MTDYYETPTVEVLQFENDDRIAIRPCTADDPWDGCGCVAT